MSGNFNKMAFLSRPIHNVEKNQVHHPKTFWTLREEGKEKWEKLSTKIKAVTLQTTVAFRIYKRNPQIWEDIQAYRVNISSHVFESLLASKAEDSTWSPNPFGQYVLLL